jgi:hypothetical protein
MVDVVITVESDFAAELFLKNLFDICEKWESALVSDDVDAAAEREEFAKKTRGALEELFTLDEETATKFGPELVDIVQRFPFLED